MDAAINLLATQRQKLVREVRHLRAQADGVRRKMVATEAKRDAMLEALNLILPAGVYGDSHRP